MHGAAEVERVLALRASGMSVPEIVDATEISRWTIYNWLRGQVPDLDAHRRGGVGRIAYECPACSGDLMDLPRAVYVYLLGLYLGDGCIYRMSKGVYRLGVFCGDDYPQLIQQCEDAMAAVLPTKVGRVQKIGCTEVTSYSKHWPCLFPQAGPGMKHRRKIELAEWQQALVDVDPRPLLKGLIHSDGCRVLNHAVRRDGREYPAYPRYHFTNASADIREIFCAACDAIGVEWRQNNDRNISVAKRASVAILDEFVGPKE